MKEAGISKIGLHRVSQRDKLHQISNFQILEFVYCSGRTDTNSRAPHTNALPERFKGTRKADFHKGHMAQ